MQVSVCHSSYSRVSGPDSVIRLEISHDRRDSSGAKKVNESHVGDKYRCIGKGSNQAFLA